MSSSRTPVQTPPMFNLAWPLLVELGLAIASSIIGTALASRISDEAGGAFAIASQVSAALFILFRIIGAGVSVVVTQNIGGGQREAANKVARAVVGASTWLGAVTALIAMAGSHGLLHLLNTPAEVFPLAAPFLIALGPAMLFDAWNASMAGVMRAHLRTRDTLVVLIIMHVSHLLLALPLMYGWGPIPALGLPGYALALTISRMVGLALHLVMWRVHLGITLVREDWWRLPRRELAAVLHIGLPGAAENIAWRLAFMVSVATAAELGAKALATQAYVLQLMGGVMMFSIATGLAGRLSDWRGQAARGAPCRQTLAGARPDGVPADRCLCGLAGPVAAGLVHAGSGDSGRRRHAAVDHRDTGAGPHFQPGGD
jgi:Na+-driven multidrug efflux pump